MTTPPVSRDFRKSVVANNLRQDVVALQVVAQLRGAGIRAIVLKGPAIRLWLYQDGPPRGYGDIDLLIDPRLLDRAESVLVASGWKRPAIDPWEADGPWHARELRGPLGASIELHRTLSGVRVEPDKAWGVLAAHTVDFALRDETVEVLDVPARAMHTALHAAQDGGRKAQSLEDFRRAVVRVDLHGWQTACRIAAELDALPAFGMGLRLDERGAKLADELGLSHETTVDLTLRRSAGLPPQALEWVATRRRGRDKAWAILQKTFPSVAFMKNKYQSARRGPLGLMLAYVQRLGWLVITFPSAMKAWRRARREAR